MEEQKFLLFCQLLNSASSGSNLVSEKDICPKRLIVMLKSLDFFSTNKETTKKGYQSQAYFQGMLDNYKDVLPSKLPREFLLDREVDHKLEIILVKISTTK